MKRSSKRKAMRQRGNGWVLAVTSLLTVFTVFVLLDAFAIERVQQQAQAADFSSIVAAQGKGEAIIESGAGVGGDDSDSTPATSAGSSADSGSDSTSKPDFSSGSDSATSSDSDSAANSDSSANSNFATATSSNSSSGPNSKPHSRHRSKSGKPSSSGKSSRSSGTDAVAVAGAGSVTASDDVLGSYSDENMRIQVSKVRAYDTDIYVADIQVTSAEYLKTALAQNAFGRNLKDTTSNMADEAGAILAINGDYYGFRDDGYVVRNGVLYRDTPASGTDALVVYGDGSMASVSQDSTTAQQLVESGAWQVFSFGPTLVSDGAVTVDGNDEVGQSMNSNPRTAIGMVSPQHYIVVVSDGRTGDNAGLSLNQLAQVLVDNGATYAYNLDGGGSTTLYFKGEILNNPTSGNSSGERKVSDIVYFG